MKSENVQLLITGLSLLILNKDSSTANTDKGDFLMHHIFPAIPSTFWRKAPNGLTGSFTY